MPDNFVYDPAEFPKAVRVYRSEPEAHYADAKVRISEFVNGVIWIAVPRDERVSYRQVNGETYKTRALGFDYYVRRKSINAR